MLSDSELTGKQFDETFPQMKYDIETPKTTGKIVSNTKTILKLEAKISAIKGYLDCKISALSDKTNTLSASIDLALKAIEEKQEKTIQNLEQNIDFLQEELATKNEFIKAIMDTQKDLVNTLFNNQEISSQNLKHCCCQQNEQNEQPSPQSQQSQQTHFRSSHNRNNQHHHTQYRTDQSQFPDQNYQKSHQPQSQHQTQPQQTSLYIGNLDQEVNVEDLYEPFGLKSTKYLSENSYIDFVIDEQTGKLRVTHLSLFQHILVKN